MIGLLASMGLTVAFFVSDIAFTDTKLQVRVGVCKRLASGVLAWPGLLIVT